MRCSPPGTIGGPRLNAADFQIGTSTALLATFEDVQPLLAGRPAAMHARRVAPSFPGRMPTGLPVRLAERLIAFRQALPLRSD